VFAPGHGITGMRERLEAADGWLTVQAPPGRGLILQAWVPAMKEPS
jgi:signal transduction histidine kinase